MSLMRTLSRFLGKAPTSCAVVLVAAGSSTRMGGEDKLLAELGGMSVLERAALALEQNARVSELIVVTRADQMEQISRLLHARNLSKLTVIVPGGKTRTASVEAGLNHVSRKAPLVAIHDAARPLVSQAVITAAIDAAAKTGAAAPAIPVKDTIKTAKDHIVADTPDRSALFAVQTPQVFDYDLLRGALKKAQKDGIALTDDCSAAEHMGLKVVLTPGDETNLKITTPLDLRIARLILEDKA